MQLIVLKLLITAAKLILEYRGRILVRVACTSMCSTKEQEEVIA